MVALFIPLLAIAGVGNLRAAILVLWLVVAAILCVSLGWYWIFRSVRAPHPDTTWVEFCPNLFVIPFAIHALVTAADIDRRLIASAEIYFSVFSKILTSLIFAGLLAGVLRSLCWVGGGLFGMIGIDGVRAVVDQGWFWIPATVGAVCAAFHVADERAATMRSGVKMVFNLASWLLIPAVAIGLAFLVALFFTGLSPLWAKHPTAGLLAAAIGIILLICFHFQDGNPDPARMQALVHARSIAVLLLLPLVILAGVGLALRVGEYGWTSLRIVAVATLSIVACYAVGYAMVILRAGEALRGLGTANAIATSAMVLILILLSSPVADPARLWVADQMAHLREGKVTAHKFDFDVLAGQGGRYGFSALQDLKENSEGPDAAYIASRADDALTAVYGWKLNH
jgi:hypothetical protein